MQRRAAEFFAGIGLMRLGLEKEGWTTVWANDIDANKRRMYLGHFSADPAKFVLGDVHRIKGDDIPDIELATASFPCNDLSLAGARQGLNGSHSGAFWGFVQALESMGSRRPRLTLLENVAGFLTSRGGADFRDALLALNRLGYAVDAFLIDAARFVPQSRRRLFVTGHLLATESASPPAPASCSLRPPALAAFISENPEIRWSLQTLADPPSLLSRLDDIVEDIPADSPLWWSTERRDYLLGQMSERHRAAAERMVSEPRISHGSIFRRVRNGRSMGELRSDGIAGCLRTPRGGSGRQILFRAGHGDCRVRLFTPRECARLMGADNYTIDVPTNQALFGFGDAVCVPVIQWVAKNCLNPLLRSGSPRPAPLC